jgi:DNA helicase-2/ATP-dependent DNA helicase PcrA
VIAAAGGGKTTRIVDEVLAVPEKRAAIITYTRNNINEIQSKFHARGCSVPENVEILSWYTFLLREMARPYQDTKIDLRIDGIRWVETTPDRFARKDEPDRYYLGGTRSIYSNKLAEFVEACNSGSSGAVIRRLEQRFERIYIDEIQDVAGYDIDIIEAMLRSNIEVVLVGDPRQSTYSTNNSLRHKKFRGPDIVLKFKEWEKKRLAVLEHHVDTHRCNQMIADLADSFYPLHERTKSRNEENTGHDGIFFVKRSEVGAYVEVYQPQILRLKVTTDCLGFSALNFGESKGMTFDRVLIFPHKKGTNWLRTGNYDYVSGVLAELYVGVSRARYSVGFVHEGETAIAGQQYP